jgi:hypothetical protein
MAAGEQVSAPSTTQTETAPQPCGAAVTAANLAGRPALSSRRAADGSGNGRTAHCKFDLLASVRGLIMSVPTLP